MTKDLKNKAIKIKGKDYVQVKDRLSYLSEEIKDYSVETGYDYYPERKMWVVRAILKIGGNVYTGLAQEIESDDYKQVNFASALENCETSAVGRACAMAGIGVLDSIASVDEMHKAGNRSVRENVPMMTITSDFNSKDAVKALEGSRWNSEAKKWMAADTKQNRTALLSIQGITSVVDSEGVIIDLGKVSDRVDEDVKEIIDNDLPF